MLDSDRYRELSEGSVIQQETWLVSSSSHFYGDLTDTDWEQIFTNLEKHPDSFSRYYSLFCIQLDKAVIRHAVMALVVNDELYTYARSLPQLSAQEEGS